MYYQKAVKDVLQELQSGKNGITDQEAEKRLDHYGPNSIEEEKATPWWLVFLKQFKDPLIYILLVSAIVTFLIEHYVDSAVILAVVIINAVIGFIQEYKAEKAMQALKQLTQPKAVVVRNAEEKRISASALVPGDVVILSAGNRVPADVRIIEERELEVDESMLTGESTKVEKHTGAIDQSNVPVADQTNMAFMGTILLNGNGRGIVTATGSRSELGKISERVKKTEKVSTPLQRSLVTFSKRVGAISIALSVIIALAGIIAGIPWEQMALVGISIAVAVIPEGLPVVITITMAIGLKRMADRNAIVRKLIAVETLGSCNYICSDKTGTITENKMTVTKAYANNKAYEIRGTGYQPRGDILHNGSSVEKDEDLYTLLLTGMLCNASYVYREDDEWVVEGDPTEAALIVSAAKYGLNREKLESEYEMLDEIPFKSKRQYMSRLYRKNGTYRILVKGAPEKILAFSGKAQDDRLSSQYSAMAEQGLRILGFGVKEVASPDISLEKESMQGLTFVGFQGIIDPPRRSAVRAIKDAQTSGIKVVMVTGDHKKTAASIAREIGILGEHGMAVTGQELDEKGEDFLRKNAERIQVYARVSPHHKVRIIEALQEQGNTVAVTGDGINDAPALKKAHIGVSMGITGTDVAKEASEVVIKDDNFATIYEAVKIGRAIFDNIRKVIVFLLVSAFAFPIAIIGALLIGLPLPFLATQVLWVNLVTNGLQDIALAYEPPEKGIAARPPRNPQESIVNLSTFIDMTIIGVTYSIIILIVYWLTLENGAGITYARSAALNTIVFAQFFHVWNSRSLTESVLRIPFFSNPFLFVSLVLAILAQVAILTIPALQYVFDTTQLSAGTWTLTITVSFSVIIVMEIRKVIKRKSSSG